MENILRIFFIYIVFVSLLTNTYCLKCLICHDIDDRSLNLHDSELYPYLNSNSNENNDPSDFGSDNHDSISYERVEEDYYFDSPEIRPKQPIRNNNIYYEPEYPAGNNNEIARKKPTGSNNNDNARKKPTGGNDSDNFRKQPTKGNNYGNAHTDPPRGNDNDNFSRIQSRNFGSDKEDNTYGEKKNDPVNFKEGKGASSTTESVNKTAGVEISDKTKDKSYIISFQESIEDIESENKYSPEVKGFKKLTKTKFFYQVQPVRPENEIVAKKETIYYIE